MADTIPPKGSKCSLRDERGLFTMHHTHESGAYIMHGPDGAWRAIDPSRVERWLTMEKA